MARHFNGTSDYLVSASVLSALASVQRIAIGFWINTVFAADDDMLVELSANSNSNAGSFMVIGNESGTSHLWASIFGNVGVNAANNSGASISSSTWHHILVNMDMTAATNEIDTIYVDGTAITLNHTNTSNNTGNFASYLFYVMSRAGTSLWADGDMADLAIWAPSSVLSSSDATSLAGGARASSVRGGELAYYWPLAGTSSPEPASVGSINLTVSGATGSSDPPGLASSDTTPPSDVTDFVIGTVGATTAVLTSATATDDVAVVSYDVSIDGGSTSYQTGIAAGGSITGLTASTLYHVKVKARDAAGNISVNWSAKQAEVTTGTAGTSSTLWASGTPTTSGSTWTNATNATGANNAAYATFTNATNGAVGYIRCAGYGAQAAVNGGSQPSSIGSLTVQVWNYEATTSRWTSVTVGVYDGTTLLGSAQTMTLSATTTFNQTFTFSGSSIPTWAQLATLEVRVTSTKSGTTSSTSNCDAASVTVPWVNNGTVTYITAATTAGVPAQAGATKAPSGVATAAASVVGAVALLGAIFAPVGVATGGGGGGTPATTQGVPAYTGAVAAPSGAPSGAVAITGLPGLTGAVRAPTGTPTASASVAGTPAWLGSVYAPAGTVTAAVAVAGIPSRAQIVTPPGSATAAATTVGTPALAGAATAPAGSATAAATLTGIPARTSAVAAPSGSVTAAASTTGTPTLTGAVFGPAGVATAGTVIPATTQGVPAYSGPATTPAGTVTAAATTQGVPAPAGAVFAPPGVATAGSVIPATTQGIPALAGPLTAPYGTPTAAASTSGTPAAFGAVTAPPGVATAPATTTGPAARTGTVTAPHGTATAGASPSGPAAVPGAVCAPPGVAVGGAVIPATTQGVPARTGGLYAPPGVAGQPFDVVVLAVVEHQRATTTVEHQRATTTVEHQRTVTTQEAPQ